MGWGRIRAWFKSLKPGSDEEILSWEFGTLSEEPELEYNHRRSVSSNEVVRSASTSASTLGLPSERDVLDAVRRELHEETKPILEIFHLSQTYLAGEGPVLPVPSPALSEAEGVVGGSPVEGPVDVLQGFSLQVKPGEFVSILDPTPVGQVANLSYLLSLIGGLSRPTRGAVYLDGQEVWHLPAWKRSRLRQEKISFLFREPKLLPHLNVLENVLVALEPSLHSPFSILRPSWWEKRRRAREVLAQVGLGDRLHCRPGELTPAEQQRVALARALAANPALILADEPTEGLDADETRRFVALLREQCRHHDPSPALRRGSPRLPLRLRSGQGSGKAGQGPGHGLAFVLATQDSEVAQAADRMVELPVRRACPERSRRVANLPSTPFWERQSAGDFLSELYEAELGDLSRPLARIFDLVVRPLLFTLAVAAVIAYLCFFGLRMAGRGQAGLSGEVWRVAGESAVDASRYLAQVARGDLGIYHRPVRSWYWIQEEIPVAEMLGRSLDKSLVLLCVAVALGGLIGVPLGIGAALVRRSHLSLVFLVLSIAGVSIPSFFMAFLLQILEVQLCRRMDLCLVPLGGFGWDRHIVLPALVLAARPIAQVASVSFATLTEVLDADYVRTARAKGLSARLVLIRHALPNAGVPILTALGTSLRFSLSSLPVVEVLFNWPGLGMLLLQAIQQYQVETATAAILCLGLFFIAINMGLERVYRVVNPRLREEQKRLTRGRSWLESLSGAWYSLQDVPDRLAEWLPWGKPTANQEEREKPVLSVACPEPRRRIEGTGLPPLLVNRGGGSESAPEELRRAATMRQERLRAWRQNTLGSLPFTVGGLIVLTLVAVFIFGPEWAPHDPYNLQIMTYINGELTTPPFAPSDVYPLGSDGQGRDVLSLILVGARRTLTLAFFAVLARLTVGAVLGCLAGWFANSALDRFLLSVVEVIAAFPALLLAMVLVYALGIRQGVWVFVVALCAVGWGEPLQFVRSQVMSIREKEYIEGAWATGLGNLQILVRHVLPNLLPSLMVLTFLEMGGALMLLGELGFMGVFIGGGIAREGGAVPTVIYFDVPEWGVILSNTWRGFRAHPWMAFYPALALTVAILGVNLFGEGLRRLTERLTLNLNRLVNRYTVGTTLAVVVAFVLGMNAVGPLATYVSRTSAFDAQRVMADIQYLAGPELNGRLTGTANLDVAADYIAARFQEVGLQSAGEMVGVSYTYFQNISRDYRDLTGTPKLTLEDAIGRPIMELEYGRDFVECPDTLVETYQVQGDVVFVGLDPEADVWPDTGSGVEGIIDPSTLSDTIVLYTGEPIPYALRRTKVGAFLAVRPQEELGYRHLPSLRAGLWSYPQDTRSPQICISPAVAELLLASTGYTLADLSQQQARLGDWEGFSVETGAQGELILEAAVQQGVETRNVVGFIPGVDVALDEEAIIVMAHYDGLGRAPDGTLYPGANDNASGVAMMLEIARMWQEQDFRPKRTVIFVAWAGAERHLKADVERFLRARRGFVGAYRIVAVVELIGVGASEGEEKILLDRGTSDRVTVLFQKAARRVGVETTTRGEGIHDDYSLYPYPGGDLAQISLTWEGSGLHVHTPADNVENIDPDKLSKMGRTAALGLMVLARETQY